MSGSIGVCLIIFHAFELKLNLILLYNFLRFYLILTFDPYIWIEISLSRYFVGVFLKITYIVPDNVPPDVWLYISMYRLQKQS